MTPLLLMLSLAASPLEVARRFHHELAAAAKSGPRALLSAGADMFDAPELTRRALGADAERLDEGQRAQLAEALGRLLRATWAQRAAAAAGTAYSLDLREQTVSGDEATVRGSLRADATYAISIALVRHGRWRVVDVTLDGVSALDAWRQQLHAVLERRGPAGLVTLVRERADAVATEAKPPAPTAAANGRKAPDPMEALLFGGSPAVTGLGLLRLWAE